MGSIKSGRSLLKKLYDPFLWIGFNFLKATEPLWEESLLLTTKSAETPGTHLIDLRRMAGPSLESPSFESATPKLGIKCLIYWATFSISSWKSKQNELFFKKTEGFTTAHWYIEISPATTKKLQHFLIEWLRGEQSLLLTRRAFQFDSLFWHNIQANIWRNYDMTMMCSRTSK